MPLSFFYFDLGNVLLNFSRDVACRQMGELAGMDPERVRQVVFGSGLEDRFERGAIGSRLSRAPAGHRASRTHGSGARGCVNRGRSRGTRVDAPGQRDVADRPPRTRARGARLVTARARPGQARRLRRASHNTPGAPRRGVCGRRAAARRSRCVAVRRVRARRYAVTDCISRSVDRRLSDSSSICLTRSRVRPRRRPISSNVFGSESSSP